MCMASIQKQFTKLQILSAQLQSQPEVQAQIKPMLRVQEDQAGDKCYKEVKDALLELFVKLLIFLTHGKISRFFQMPKKSQ